MNAEGYQKVKDLFNSILEIEPEGRLAYLDEKCSSSSAIRGEVERLLNVYESGYLEQPAIKNVAGEA